MWDILNKLEMLTGRTARIVRRPARPGDQRQTQAVTGKIASLLGWNPKTPLDEGLARQLAWQEFELGDRYQMDSFVGNSEPVLATVG